MYKFLKLKKSDGKYKYEAIFLNTENNREKTVKFGASGYNDWLKFTRILERILGMCFDCKVPELKL